MKSIFAILFNKKLKAFEEEINKKEDKIYELSNIIKAMEYEKKEFSELIDYILNYPSYCIYKRIDRCNSILFVVKDEGLKDLNFYLYSIKYKRQVPRLYTTKCTEYKNGMPLYKYLFIDDFIAVDENIGNGKILMENLIEYAKKMGYHSIDGRLSPVDKDHFDKLKYFYEKFGFEVELSQDKSNGSIKLMLIK